MKRTIILPALIAAFVALSPAGVALADNPHSPANPDPNAPATGQPSQEAEPDASPPGFSTGLPGGKGQVGKGFANAETHYAGSPGTPSAANGNAHAVSQYDVAGFQCSQHPNCPAP
jgi:hypothetical protein